MNYLKRLLATPQGLLVGSFLSAIVLGGLLLSLPISQTHQSVDMLDAFFTATSAVCVTGLAVADTGKEFTIFGQAVILVLIQLGGLGVMTFAGIALMLVTGRIPLRSQEALSDTLLQHDAAHEFKTMLWRMLRITALIESIGALLIFGFLVKDKPGGHALWSAVFHSISAFCNAGFSLYSDSLIGLKHNSGLVMTVATLIILGGIGLVVLMELAGHLKNWRTKQDCQQLSLHTRTVLVTSTILLLGGFLFLIFYGLGPDDRNLSDRMLDAAFQSVTARTAGFNTLEIGHLPVASLFFLSVLMFIGGSPGSCAGGVKTTTVAIWLARIRCRLIGRSDTYLLGRTVPVELVRRATVLVSLALLFNLVGILLLLGTEAKPDGVDFMAVLFEQISAFGTVGLSTGLTPELSTAGRVWIILTMFIGRLGPLTMALWAIPLKKATITYPTGKVMIG
jgi:trk system potassium uptake protein TrkH